MIDAVMVLWLGLDNDVIEPIYPAEEKTKVFTISNIF